MTRHRDDGVMLVSRHFDNARADRRPKVANRLKGGPVLRNHDASGAFKQIRAGRLDARLMRTGERMSAHKAYAAHLLIEKAFHASHIRHNSTRFEERPDPLNDRCELSFRSTELIEPDRICDGLDPRRPNGP